MEHVMKSISCVIVCVVAKPVSYRLIVPEDLDLRLTGRILCYRPNIYVELAG